MTFARWHAVVMGVAGLLFAVCVAGEEALGGQPALSPVSVAAVNPQTGQIDRTLPPGETFELSKSIAVAWYGTSRDTFLLSCLEGTTEEIEVSPWTGPGAALTFTRGGRLEDGHLLLRIPARSSRIVIRARAPLGPCNVAEITASLSEAQWQARVAEAERLGPKPELEDGRELRVLLRASQGRWTEGSASTLNAAQRRAAAVLVAPMSASAVDVRRILDERPFCANRPEWLAAPLKDAPQNKLSSGFVEWLFWPALPEPQAPPEVCFELTIDGSRAPLRCVPSTAALAREARLADATAVLRADDGRIVGAPIRVRLALDRTRSVELRPVGVAGWISVRWFAPKRGWLAPRRTLSSPIVSWPPAAEETDTSSGWTLLAPTEPPGSHLLSRLLLAPATRPAPTTTDMEDEDAVVAEPIYWVPIDGEPVTPALDERGRNRVDLLFQRRGPWGAPCAAIIEGQPLAGALLEELTPGSVLTPTSAAVKIEVQGQCTVWRRAVWSERPAEPSAQAHTLSRYYRVEPRGSLLLSVPGPPIAGLLQLRAFIDEDADAASGTPLALEVGSRRLELSLFGQGPQRMARRSVELLPGDGTAAILNLSNSPVWVTMALRAPLLESVSPNPRLAQKDRPPAQEPSGDLVSLRRDLALRPAGQRRFFELLSLSQLLSDEAQISLARDTLFLAAQAASNNADIEAVRAQDEQQRAELDSLSAAVSAGLIMPLSRWLVPVLPEELDLDLGQWRRPQLQNAPYAVAMALRAKYIEDPSAAASAELLLIHAIAEQHEDWLLAAWATAALRARHSDLSTHLCWLRELVWAAQGGQYVPDETRLEAASLAARLVEQLGPQLQPLARALAALTTWEETNALFGIDRTVVLAEGVTAQQDIGELARFAQAWDSRSVLELRSGDRRLIELALPGVTQARLEVQWAVRLDEKGHPPACRVVVRAAAHKPLIVAAPDDPLDATSRFSQNLRLGPGPTPLLVELSCANVREQARARLRLWLDKKIPGFTTPAPQPEQAMTQLLVLRGERRWLKLSAGRTATLDVLGPTVLRVSALAEEGSGKRAAVLHCVSPSQAARSAELVDTMATGLNIVELALDEAGPYACNVQADRGLVFSVAYRRPDQTASLLRRSLTLPQPEVELRRAEVRPLAESRSAAASRLRGKPSADPGPGAVWAGWMAAEDSVVRESNEPRPWVTGPRAGWHSQAKEGVLWWKVDTELRLRPQGSPAGLVTAALVAEPGLDFVLKPRLGFAWQEINGALGWSVRGGFEVEKEIELWPGLRLVPALGIRGAWSRVQSVEGVGAETVDSLIYNQYLADHAAALTPGLAVKLRPLDPLLLKGELRYVTNENLNPADPDRLDLDLDAFGGFDFGLVARLSAGLSTRFADDDRQRTGIVPSLGGGLSYAYWLSRDTALYGEAFGTYTFVLNTYDAAIFVGLAFSFGSGLSDDHPSWTPLPSYLEKQRPLAAELVPR